jgi:hypothetical protein
MSISRKAKDGFSTVLREAVDTLRTKDRVHALSANGIQEIAADPTLWRSYKSLLSEGCTADTAETLDILFDNFQTTLFHENTLSSITPVSALTMPMLRKAWPKIGMKEALPTEPVKTPKFTVSTLSPYLMDPVSGQKLLLPSPGVVTEYNDGGSQRFINSATPLALPAINANVMPTGYTVAAGYTLDPIFSVVGVDIVVKTAANGNATTLTNVKVYNGAAETRQGNILVTVTATNPVDGNTTSDTLFGYVSFADGTLTLTSTGAGGATATNAQIVNVYLSGKIESTLNMQSTQVGFDVLTTEIAIGTGEHFDAPLPLEWLQDNLALYNIDGTLKVVDIMTEILAQRVDLQAIQFVQQTFLKGAALNGTNFVRTFDVYPTGNYNGSPTDWLNELRRITDNLVQSMRNVFNFGGGQFVIVGNPIDIALYPGINWIFTAETGDQKDGVEVNYQIGAVSGAQRYAMFTSQNFAPGTIYVFFIPGPDDQKVLTYYPYTFNVERSSSGFVSPNTPNVPSVLMTKRQVFKDFLQMVGQINILHNDGTLPV